MRMEIAHVDQMKGTRPSSPVFCSLVLRLSAYLTSTVIFRFNFKLRRCRDFWDSRLILKCGAKSTIHGAIASSLWCRPSQWGCSESEIKTCQHSASALAHGKWGTSRKQQEQAARGYQPFHHYVGSETQKFISAWRCTGPQEQRLPNIDRNLLEIEHIWGS